MSEPPADGDADNYHPNLATHAERSANSLIQPSRKLSKLSDAQKASQLLRRTANQDEHKRLIEDLDVLLLRHSQEQEELAEKYCLKPEYLKKLKGTSKHYKAKRVVNIENAKIHMKSVEVNAGNWYSIFSTGLLSSWWPDREVGDRLRIAEIRQLVKDDPDFQDLSKAQETELREELLASRDLKRLGARPSNRSAAQDYRRQLKQLNNEVCKTVVVILILTC